MPPYDEGGERLSLHVEKSKSEFICQISETLLFFWIYRNSLSFRKSIPHLSVNPIDILLKLVFEGGSVLQWKEYYE